MVEIVTDSEILDGIEQVARDENVPEVVRAQLAAVLRDRAWRLLRRVTDHERALHRAARDVQQGIGSTADVAVAAVECLRRPRRIAWVVRMSHRREAALSNGMGRASRVEGRRC